MLRNDRDNVEGEVVDFLDEVIKKFDPYLRLIDNGLNPDEMVSEEFKITYNEDVWEILDRFWPSS